MRLDRTKMGGYMDGHIMEPVLIKSAIWTLRN